MATFEQFARNIRALGRGIERNTNDAIIRAAGIAQTNIILATPVLTGHARLNWQVVLVEAPTLEIPGGDPSGQAAITRNQQSLGVRQLGQAIYISNIAPYIVPLNQGSSAQAPAGFVEAGVVAAVSTIRNARVVRR